MDYIHSSIYSNANAPEKAYKRHGNAGNVSRPLNELLKEKIGGRAALVVCGQIKSADEALDALRYGDICACGVLSLSDPKFLEKIQDGREDEIQLDVTGRLSEIKFTTSLMHMYLKDTSNGGLPPIEGLSPFFRKSDVNYK